MKRPIRALERAGLRGVLIFLVGVMGFALWPTSAPAPHAHARADYECEQNIGLFFCWSKAHKGQLVVVR